MSYRTLRPLKPEELFLYIKKFRILFCFPKTDYPSFRLDSPLATAFREAAGTKVADCI